MSLNGSTWNDNGYSVVFTETTLTYPDMPSQYHNMHYDCSNNTLTYNNAGTHISTATIADDGMVAVFSAPEVSAVWTVVAWPQTTPCILRDGRIVNDGNSIILYKNRVVSPGNNCLSESRTCANGSLSGSYRIRTCEVAPPGTRPVIVVMLVAFVLLIGWWGRRHYEEVE